MRPADTDVAGYDVGIGGGRTIVSLGAASLAAAIEVRTKLLAAAATLLDASPDDLVMENGRIEVASANGYGFAIAEVAARARTHRGRIGGTGAFIRTGVPAMAGCCTGHFIEAIDIPIFAVHDCEAAVDPDTRHVEILNYTVVQDVGRAINPSAVHGKIQGGVVQGLGYALHEEVTIDGDGRVRQAGFETYRLPTAQDVAPVAISLYEGAPSLGPLGTKAGGEVPILHVAATVANAVSNAIGRQVRALPMTPPNVLARMQGRTVG
ncbi:molybdopterin cofactor-binding domain-containing protein [Aureimonas pseudogalii]|uniref:CO/xanthine dehydrogenase Mo-binding subunit n=1 Tax=Aureimonas pseudogalii TaxID=1744844 RepID=A0A7W6MKT4_9HYPH|nr:CO/xanthine dehydrogenase Mo-binding subunit [Aureimonas pseudogalii]